MNNDDLIIDNRKLAINLPPDKTITDKSMKSNLYFLLNIL